MPIHDWTDNVIFVDLPSEPQMADELSHITKIVSSRYNCDVIIDFSSVDVVTSLSLTMLLKLQKMLTEHDCRLVLCNVTAPTKGIFAVTGLDKIFEFADDRLIALAARESADGDSGPEHHF